MAAVDTIKNNQQLLSIDDDQEDAGAVINFIHWIIVFVIIPAISILGAVGNTFSLIVLYKHGFKKSSNILLFTLAIGDITFMIGVNGPAKVMYEWGRGGFWFPEPSARVLYYFYHFFDMLNWGSSPASMCIPVLITVERLVAVYLPLKFPLIITPRRTLVAALIPFIFFYGVQAYVRAWFQFVYVFDACRNTTRGVVARSELYWRQRNEVKAVQLIFNSMFGMVLFVGTGCIAIGVKVKLAASKRVKMTQSSDDKQGRKDASTARTTKMLLCLCVVYTFCMAFVTLPIINPHLMSFPLFMDKPNFRSLSVFTYHIFKLSLCINASCNFVIYVALNKKFRDTFVELMGCKK